MAMEITLAQLRPGDGAKITHLALEGNLRRRLQDIGLIAGTTVRCVGKSPGGDPMAYAVRGAVIALRQEDAARIFVNREGADG